MSKKQIAVLVDAGYFFAQAAETLFGGQRQRHEVEIDEAKALLCIEEIAKNAFPGRELLRVYWYDAPPSRNADMSPSQERLALKPGVKLRLGTLNGTGQQKGVDALIINDLTQLARDGSADRFVLMSGDEDLRMAVEQAQACGAQVRIMAIGPGNASIGLALRREVDGIDHFDAELLAECMSSRAGRGPEPRPATSKTARKGARSKNKIAPGDEVEPRAALDASEKSLGYQATAAPREEEPEAGEGRSFGGAEPPRAERSNDSGRMHGEGSGTGRSKRRRSRGKNRQGRAGEPQHDHQDGGSRADPRQSQASRDPRFDPRFDRAPQVPARQAPGPVAAPVAQMIIAAAPAAAPEKAKVAVKKVAVKKTAAKKVAVKSVAAKKTRVKKVGPPTGKEAS